MATATTTPLTIRGSTGKFQKGEKRPARELKAKQYRLLKYQPLTFVLKVGRNNTLLVWDKELGYNRAIRHCPNEKTIFIDEQSKGAVVKPIIFLKGLLETKDTDTITQEFLERHPKNGSAFELVDDAVDAQGIADTEELILDVKQAIRNKIKTEGGIEELRVIVSVMNSNVEAAAKMEPAELKTALYNLVNVNIHRFVNEKGDITVFDDPEIKRQAIAQHSFNSGVIRIAPDGSKIVWTDNKETICMVPTGKDAVLYFAEWLGTEEGIQVAVEISKR